MIDVATEQVVNLREACRLIPSRKSGKRVHIGTMHRWATKGVRGVRLETVRLGGMLCTSVEAVQRFGEQSTTGERHDDPQCRTTRRRLRDQQRAEAELAQAGVL